MALSSFVGTFTAPTSNGTQSITGVGFEPKFIKIIGIATGNAIVSDAKYLFGAASGSGSTEQFGISAISLDALSTTNTFRSMNTGVLVNLMTTPTTFQCVGSLQSFDSDGFTLNWTTTSSAQTIIYVAMGGSSLDVDVGVVSWPSTSGNFSKTGVGFEPKSLEAVAVFGALGSNLSDLSFSQGFATSSSSRSTVFNEAQDNLGTSNTYRYASESRVIIKTDSSGVVDTDVDFISFDSDGFTLDNTNPPTTSQDLAYIAWGGSISAFCSSLIQPATTGTQSITGVGFEPNTTFFNSINNPNLDLIQVQATSNNGVGNATNDGHLNIFVSDNQATSNSSRDGGQGQCIGSSTNTTAQSEANYDSNDSDGFTLDWGVSDGGARVVFYLCIGDAPTGVTIPVFNKHFRNQGMQ